MWITCLSTYNPYEPKPNVIKLNYLKKFSLNLLMIYNTFTEYLNKLHLINFLT